MVNRFCAVVRHQILLADIGDVAAFHIFGEQVIKGLVPARADVGGIDSYHSSLLAKTGSTSKITPRKSNSRWRTTSPIEKLACAMLGMFSGVAPVPVRLGEGSRSMDFI